MIIATVLVSAGLCAGQPPHITIDEAVKLALAKNPAAQASALERRQYEALRPAAIDIPKTDVALMLGQYNSIQKNDNNITVVQTVPFPTVLHRQHMLGRRQVEAAGFRDQVTRNGLAYQVRQVFVQLLYLQARGQVLLREDSLMKRLQQSAALQYKTGETTWLAKTSAETQALELGNQISRNAADQRSTWQHLQLLCQTPIAAIAGSLEALDFQTDTDTTALAQNPALGLTGTTVSIAAWQRKLETARMWPDLRVGYFNQTLIGTQAVNGQDRYFGPGYRFQGFEVGLAIPLWFPSHTARIKAGAIGQEVAQKQADATRAALLQQHLQASEELAKNANSLAYYREGALKTTAMLEQQSLKAFEAGEIDLTTHVLNLRQALSIREGYLEALHQYHQSQITLQYLNGNQP